MLPRSGGTLRVFLHFRPPIHYQFLKSRILLTRSVLSYNIHTCNNPTMSNQAAWLEAKRSPLKVGSAPMPKAGPGEVVIKNAAVSINPVDCKTSHFCFRTVKVTIFRESPRLWYVFSSSRIPNEKLSMVLGIIIESWPAILGCDVAGEIYEVGEGVTNVKKGDRAMG